MKIMEKIPLWGDHEEKTLAQFRTSAATADRAALMADGHLDYAVPIGAGLKTQACRSSSFCNASPDPARGNCRVCRPIGRTANNERATLFHSGRNRPLTPLCLTFTIACHRSLSYNAVTQSLH
jgi:hypothetical protein